MKCPKCGYLGFEEVQRCRNCGYDFSLAPAPTLPDLSIRQDEATMDRLADLSLESESRADRTQPFGQFEPLLSPPLASATPQPGISAAPEFPLFRTSGNDDAPLITRASPPRPPLAVRRASPEGARRRGAQPATPMFDLEPGDEAAEVPGARGEATPGGEWRARQPQVDATEPAPLVARVTAFVIDMAVLGAVDVVVVYLTLRICGITLDELHILPKLPLMVFLLVQNGGYLVAFTLGGQTLGKMAAGIKVVPAVEDEVLDLGRSILRASVWLLLAVPAGLGFLTALFSRDRRGLHDHFAGTRVVRAPTG